MLKYLLMNRAERRAPDCTDVCATLTRYVDNDLSAALAAPFAAHLHGCVSCRAEYESMRAQRLVLAALPAPPGAAGARERVLLRFERTLSETANRTLAPVEAPGRGSSRCAGRVILAGGAVAAVAVFTAIVASYRLPLQAGGRTAQRPSRVALVPLPASEDLAALFALHDARRSVVATPSARPILSPPAAKGSSRAHGAKDTDSARSVAAQAVPPDDIPEAL